MIMGLVAGADNRADQGKSSNKASVNDARQEGWEKHAVRPRRQLTWRLAVLACGVVSVSESLRNVLAPPHGCRPTLYLWSGWAWYGFCRQLWLPSWDWPMNELRQRDNRAASCPASASEHRSKLNCQLISVLMHEQGIQKIMWRSESSPL